MESRWAAVSLGLPSWNEGTVVSASSHSSALETLLTLAEINAVLTHLMEWIATVNHVRLPQMTSSFFSRLPGVTRRSALFTGLWLFIVFVSVVDGLLIIVHRKDIFLLERNPVGRQLLEWGHGSIVPFVIAKLACTLLVATLLLLLYWRRPRYGVPVAVALACFQFGLLMFLFFA